MTPPEIKNSFSIKHIKEPNGSEFEHITMRLDMNYNMWLETYSEFCRRLIDKTIRKSVRFQNEKHEKVLRSLIKDIDKYIIGHTINSEGCEICSIIENNCELIKKEIKEVLGDE